MKADRNEYQQGHEEDERGIRGRDDLQKSLPIRGKRSL